MTIKISSISERDTCDVDFSILKEELAASDYEDLSPVEIEEKLYQDHGVAPDKIAVADAGKFGIRRAFFDVFKPSDTTKAGVWHLEKDADGNEYIVKAQESN